MAALALPAKFLHIHRREIEIGFFNCGRVFNIVPREPLPECVVTDGPLQPEATATFTSVTVRCTNDGGVLRAEAASEADLKAAQVWAERHFNTLAEEFFTSLPPDLGREEPRCTCSSSGVFHRPGCPVGDAIT